VIELEIPNDPKIRMAVMGQVYQLTHDYNWEQFGLITTEEVAAAMQIVYDQAVTCAPTEYNYLAGYTGKLLMGTSGKRLVVFDA
jgi:hypothetical protein